MMKEDYKIAEQINDIRYGRVCTTYPLKEFKAYNGQKRNNYIGCGTVIDKTDQNTVFQTLLVQSEIGDVICVRVYPELNKL